MANQTLIRQAEKMYGSMEDTTDYASLLTQPAIDVVKDNLEKQKAITDDLISKMPAGISIDRIPEELRPAITKKITDAKNEYVGYAKVIASGIPSTDPRYLKAIDGMNRIRSGFETLDAEMTGLADKVKGSLESRDKKSKYSEEWQQTDHERFSNKGIYGSVTIGEDFKLSYLSEDGNNKFVSDYGTFLTSGTGAARVDAMRKEVMNNAKQGVGFDDPGNSNMVTALVNELGAKGIGDLMYSNPMYIDKYIELNHGGITKENNEAEYNKIYNALKKEDLTEEFTTHLLGTEEKPGMLREAHNAAFREYTPPGGGGGGGGTGFKFAGGYDQDNQWVTPSEQRRVNTSIRNKLQKIPGADGRYYVLTGDKRNYMMFDSKEQYDELYKKGGAYVGEGKGTRVDFQTVLDNNAAGTGQKAVW